MKNVQESIITISLLINSDAYRISLSTAASDKHKSSSFSNRNGAEVLLNNAFCL